MKIETYKKVLAGWWRKGFRQSVVKWQVDDSALLMISEGMGLVLSPLRPVTATHDSAAIWYHATVRNRVLKYEARTCHIQNSFRNHNCLC